MSMKEQDTNGPRKPEAAVDRMFVDRWSPRAFSEEPLTRDQVRSLLEAARWAPSCYNEQPWLIVYAVSDQDRKRFLDALVEQNRTWARRAPLILLLFARRSFRVNGKPNRHAAFDVGAAWISLAFQAGKLGLHAHCMAGINPDKAYEVTGVDKELYEARVAVAVGRRSDPSILPEDLAAMEHPNGRKPLDEVGMEGRYIPSKEG